jgi:hypothetical protein
MCHDLDRFLVGFGSHPIAQHEGVGGVYYGIDNMEMLSNVWVKHCKIKAGDIVSIISTINVNKWGMFERGTFGGLKETLSAKRF